MMTIRRMQKAGIDFECPGRAGDVQKLLELCKRSEPSPELVEVLKQLWSDSGVQSCFSGIASSEMASDTKHFLNSAELERIGQPGYSPTNLDIVRAKRNSPSLNETDCTIGGIGLQITEVEGSLHYMLGWCQDGTGTCLIYHGMHCSCVFLLQTMT